MKTTYLTLLAGAAFLGACGQSTEQAAPSQDGEAPAVEVSGNVNVYSSRHYDTDLALYEDFTEQTGIKVNLIEAGADALIERIVSEGEYSPADILITVDAGRLWRAEEAGILDSVDSDILAQRIPANLRHPDGLWFGLSKRARVIVYNKEDGQPEQLASYADLANPVHQGKICMRSSSNIYNISLMASIISHYGAEEAQDWANGVVANFARPPQGNDTSNIEAIANGDCAISVINTYYLARYAASDDATLNGIADQIGVIFPDQGGYGTHVNISGAGVVEGAPNRDNAIRFIEYLTTDGAQEYFANGNNEYPVVDGVAVSSAVVQLGSFEEDDINAVELGRNQAEAIRIFDRAGWR
ncbi:Fe(3+) ABC transporter substrate-binding protein [Aquisalinus flavus]|uniref:Iron deficiency-induced protein A n=1 Tax=Aquisalinus flavus TaxID=1526572 RepID=A0A8J2Y6K8_9PROT|nr:Fe(3+) ABC transporter substrate-binding protein [Aquisalinus flavus]MBD0426042.1 Fe(3+) ABC transporter substrate-binding protein [Aquisalinus flavus]UNE48368.1 Fe(3+) ABC transporter substrate-binding protein [Aquisalinus flavus]GGD11173.1 iron deficiency-induced protein A [Aquisalinus flavus]